MDLNMCRLFMASAVSVLVASTGATAQTTVSEAKLRDELLNHFALDNLIPVFLPRGQEVGDVLEPSGAIKARRSECFPTLQLPGRKDSNSLSEVSLELKAEGGFGIGLKRIVEFFVSTNAQTSTRLKLSFANQQFVSASTNEMVRSFSKAQCPFLSDQVEGKSVAADLFGTPLLVIQEIFYAKKRLSIEVSRSADLQATVKGVETAVVPLGGNVQVKGSTGNAILVEAVDIVPVAVRVAFLPRPITGALLGGGGSPKVLNYYWQPTKLNPISDKQGLQVVYESVKNATSGAANPLLSDD